MFHGLQGVAVPVRQLVLRASRHALLLYRRATTGFQLDLEARLGLEAARPDLEAAR